MQLELERHWVEKAVCLEIHIDAALVCGSDQLCAGFKAGIEGAILAMIDLFSNYQIRCSGWGALLADAVNAFNPLICTAMLLHARLLWLHCTRFHFNT